MKEEGKITIGFAGDAITKKNNNIDLEDLSTALTGFSNLISEANKELNGKEAELKMYVEPNFRAGSFDIIINFIKDFFDIFKEHRDVFDFIGFILTVVSSANLIEFIKWKKDKEIVNAEKIGTKIIITLADGSTKEFPSETCCLYVNEYVREEIARVLSPLFKDGIDEFYIKNEENKKITIITKEEARFFAYGENAQKSKKELPITCEIKSIDFEGKNKWRLKNIANGYDFTASFNDEKYLKIINNGEISFTAGDRIKANFEFIEYYNVENEVVNKEYNLIEVIDTFDPPEPFL